MALFKVLDCATSGIWKKLIYFRPFPKLLFALFGEWTTPISKNTELLASKLFEVILALIYSVITTTGRKKKICLINLFFT